MWIIYKNVYDNREKKLLSKDIVEKFNYQNEAEQYLQELLRKNVTNIHYNIDQIKTIS